MNEQVSGEAVRAVSFERFEFLEDSRDLLCFEGSVNFVSNSR